MVLQLLHLYLEDIVENKWEEQSINADHVL